MGFNIDQKMAMKYANECITSIAEQSINNHADNHVHRYTIHYREYHQSQIQPEKLPNLICSTSELVVIVLTRNHGSVTLAGFVTLGWH